MTFKPYLAACRLMCTQPRRALRANRTLVATLLASFTTLALAIQPVEAPQQAARSKMQHPVIAQDINVQPALEATTSLAAAAAQRPAVARFLAREGGNWEMRWDARADRPNLIQGSGIALVPGRGNSLTLAQLGLPASHQVDLATVETRLQNFITANADLLGTKDMDLRPDPTRSTGYGKDNTHWFVEFEQFHEGVRVEGANVFFRIAAGNIIQFGTQRIAPVHEDVYPVSRRDAARALAVADLPVAAGTRVREVIEPGELLLLPVAPAGTDVHADFNGSMGQGYEHKLVWRFVLRLDNDQATYQILADAHGNRVIDVRDLNAYANATVTGGVYPTTNTDPETVVPMPFAAVTNSGAKVTDALGIYDYSGGTATVTLDGKYFQMSDTCGPISLSNATDGNLNLGTSGGTDCTTPGVGGAGNTHASRTAFYHLTNINRKAITFFPSNTWLLSKVTTYVNLNYTCNAFWSGGSLNFFKSGGACSNTGELVGTLLHEWGHGMDTNSGGEASEMGSGEAVGDIFAFLETKDACISKNFFPGQSCHNCDASCTGVRDVKAFSTSGAATIAKPSNVTSDSGINCDRYACPYLSGGVSPYQGPMGYEGHCESYIASSANWDLAQALLTKYGSTQGWQEMNRIWYGSLTPSKSAYRVASGGTCNASASVDGCGSDNWYTVFLAADEDNGNLSDGTPNACRIWDAFNAHGIACGTRPVCSADVPDFTLAVTPASQGVCANPTASTSYTVNVGSQMGFSNAVALAASGLPAGVSASFSPASVVPGNSSTMTVNANGAAAAIATLTINGTASGSLGHSTTTQLLVSTVIAAMPALNTPVNGATGTARSPAFSWSSDPATQGWTIQVATDAAFTNIVASGTPTTNSWTPPSPLAAMTTYYWRVKPSNGCGDGTTSATFSFTTGQTFPDPYCAVTFTGTVEPITRVKFTGIDNRSSAATSSPAHEDFLGVAGGLVQAGQSYPMTVEGNTVGPNLTVVTAFIDVNRDGTFGSGESYPIGNISNSTGEDGTQVTASIAVPISVTPGPVRLRVIKRFSSAATACNSSGDGQAEDYTVMVQGQNPTYTVGGAVAGLTGTGLALKLNGGADLPISANGAFTFPGSLANGASYAVTVGTQPAGQTCSVANGSGTIAGANVTSVVVDCADRIFADGFETP